MWSPGRVFALCAALSSTLLPAGTARADYAVIWQEEIDVPLDFVTHPPETLTADLDGDGLDETATVAPDGKLVILDGLSGSIAYTTPFDTAVQATCPYDFDADGTVEVILAGRIGSALCVAIIDHVGPVTAAIDGHPPLPSRLLAASPNPFNPSTLISFTLGTEGMAELRIFDVQGRLVRSLVRETLAAGVHVVSWDGRDASGQRLASGHYFCHLALDGRTIGTQRAVTLK